MPAGRKWIARLLLGQLGKVPAEELALVVLRARVGLPALGLARSDRRQRHLAAVSREMDAQTMGALEAWRAVGLAKRVG